LFWFDFPAIAASLATSWHTNSLIIKQSQQKATKSTKKLFSLSWFVVLVSLVIPDLCKILNSILLWLAAALLSRLWCCGSFLGG
jgi:hypothetical protein